MVYAATLTRAGQITVPKPVREALGAEPGQKIIFNIKKKSINIERQKTAAEISKEIDKLIPDYVRENVKKHAGKTAGEFREEWLSSDEAKEYYAERLRRCL